MPSPSSATSSQPIDSAPPLDALRGWLGKENAVIMAVLLLVIGVVMIGKGIASF